MWDGWLAFTNIVHIQGSYVYEAKEITVRRSLRNQQESLCISWGV